MPLARMYPPPEAMRQPWLALTPATAGHLDGDYPLGPENWVMVVKDAPARILMTPDAASEHGEDVKPLLQHAQDLGRTVTAAVADDSQSFTEAIKAVWPQARWQADHFPTVQHSWGHLKKSHSTELRGGAFQLLIESRPR